MPTIDAPPDPNYWNPDQANYGYGAIDGTTAAIIGGMIVLGAWAAVDVGAIAAIEATGLITIDGVTYTSLTEECIAAIENLEWGVAPTGVLAETIADSDTLDGAQETPDGLGDIYEEDTSFDEGDANDQLDYIDGIQIDPEEGCFNTDIDDGTEFCPH